MCVTSWVVHVHEEHIFISIQDGIELQGRNVRTFFCFFSNHPVRNFLVEQGHRQNVTADHGVEKATVATDTN